MTTTKKLVDRLVAEYRDAVGMRPEDLSDPAQVEALAFDQDVTPEKLREENYVVGYCTDGVLCQHVHHRATAQDRAIERECRKRLAALGEEPSV